MSKSKLIVVEGPQGAGKTTVTDYIRNKLPYTNLYRLNGTADSSPTGKEKSRIMYTDLVDYIENLQNKSINLLFDRTFFTEEVYCRLKFKEYNFSDIFEELLSRLSNFDFEFYYITLYLSDSEEFEKRLDRKEKCDVKYAKFAKESSLKQQEAYLQLAKEVKEKYNNINVINIDTCKDIEDVKKEIDEILINF